MRICNSLKGFTYIYSLSIPIFFNNFSSLRKHKIYLIEYTETTLIGEQYISVTN